MQMVIIHTHQEWNFIPLFVNSWVKNKGNFYLTDWKYREFREPQKWKSSFQKRKFMKISLFLKDKSGLYTFT